MVKKSEVDPKSHEVISTKNKKKAENLRNAPKSPETHAASAEFSDKVTTELPVCRKAPERPRYSTYLSSFNHTAMPQNPPALVNNIDEVLERNLTQAYHNALQQPHKHFAHRIHYGHKREKQTQDFEKIRQAIVALPPPVGVSPSAHKENQVIMLHAAMQLLLRELQSESRWTRWAGTQSRLEGILKKDMGTLKNSYHKSVFTYKHAARLADSQKQVPALQKLAQNLRISPEFKDESAHRHRH